MEQDGARKILLEIVELLESGRGARHEDWAAAVARDALAGPETALEQWCRMSCGAEPAPLRIRASLTTESEEGRLRNG